MEVYRWNVRDKTIVVTGASRGAGRAIALVLGRAEATVYVTGRSVGAEMTESLPGTISDTGEAVTAQGDTGIAVRCDHTVDAEVEALFARVREEQGRLDLLVNNVWGGYEHHEGEGFVAPFWEQPLRHWEGMFVVGVRAHLVASRFAVPLMLQEHRGLIVNAVAWAFGEYLDNLYYDVAKAAIVRMAFGMAHELRPYGISAVALAPGLITERVMAAHAAKPFDLSATETPEYLGQAVAALAANPRMLQKSGEVLTVGDLAREYGFTDVDGRQPPAFRF